MLKLRYVMKALMALAIATSVILPTTHANAQEAQNIPVSIGIVDMQGVFDKSAAGQSLRKQAVTRRDAIRADLVDKDKQFKAERDKLAQARPTLADEEFKKQALALEQKYQSWRQDAEQKRKTFEKTYNEAQQKISQTMYEVIGKVAVEKKLTLVLNKSAAIVSASAWDISDTVLAQLNKVLPSIKL